MQFTKFAVGSGTLTDISTLTSLTELVTPVKNFNITKIDKETSTQVKVQGLFKNTDVTEGFYLRELGLYAKDLETETEILFAYINYGNNAEFVNNTADAKKEFYYDLDIAVGNAENIEIVLNPDAVYATEQDLEDLEEHSYFTKITATTSIITLPAHYKVGANVLEVYGNGEKMIKASDLTGSDGHYVEVGEEGSLSNKIQCTNDMEAFPGDIFEFIVKGVYENEET